MFSSSSTNAAVTANGRRPTSTGFSIWCVKRAWNGASSSLVSGPTTAKFEVDLFKRRYQVPFPLIPDRKLEAFKALGAQGTPQFFVILIRKKPVIAMIVSGFLPEPPDALEEIMRKSGLKTD